MFLDEIAYHLKHFLTFNSRQKVPVNCCPKPVLKTELKSRTPNKTLSNFHRFSRYLHITLVSFLRHLFVRDVDRDAWLQWILSLSDPITNIADELTMERGACLNPPFDRVI